MQRAILGCHLAAMLGWTLISVVQAQGPAPSPLILGPSPPPAQVPAVAPETSPGPELTKADFETFLDALIPSQLRNRNIAGAVVSVVKDGQVLFQKGYCYADFEAKKPRDFEFVQAAPAGSLSTTAADMTRFILAFLQDGSVDGVAILKPETVRQMETRQFELHPMINGLGVTFMEYCMDPVRVIAHGGDTVYFHSDMVLVPDAHVGYFVSYNSLGKNVGAGRGEVWRTFVNRYFPIPGEPKVEVDPNTSKSDGHAVSGVYDGTRRGETTLLKILALLDQVRVSSDKDGVVTVEGDKNQRGELKKWKEIAPLVYSEVDGLERIAFRRDASGTVREMLPFPAIYEGQRVPWYASKIFVGLVIGGSLVLALLTVVLWPVAVLIRRKYERPLFSAKRDRVLYFLSRIVCLGELIFILTPVIAFSQGLEHIVILGDTINPWLQAFHFFGWLLMVGVVVLIVAAARFVRLPGHGLWFRVHAILLAIGGIAFGLFAWQYHLLDTSLRF